MGSLGGRVFPVAVLVAAFTVLSLCLVVPSPVDAGVVADEGSLDVSEPTPPSQQAGWPLQEDQPEPDNTVTRIALAGDGSAVWTVTFRTELATSENVSEYERFQTAFRNNRSQYIDPFRERITGVVSTADDRLNRSMNATAFEAETTIQEVPRRWGIIRFSFRWDGFGAVSGERVTVGDVFEGGFFIGPDDALAIETPEGYAIHDVAPEPDERDTDVVEWRGREDFSDGRPYLVTRPDSESGPAGEGGIESIVGDRAGVVLAVATIVVVLFFGWLVVRRGWLEWPRTDEHSETATTSGPDGPPTDASTGGGAELLTDYDRVEQLLADRGARLKQSEIAEALDWSESKTSRVLSDMEEEGTVEKLRLGRENVIDLIDDEAERE